jgi:hypothetical protein
MKSIEKIKYPIIVLLLALTFNANSQEEFISFLKQAELPACFKNLESNNVDEIFEYGRTTFESFEISSHYDPSAEVFEITTKENCHDTKKLQLKYVDHLSGEYVFLYRERIDGEQSYGTIMLYEYQDSLWTQGKEIAISWTHLFDIDEEELEELRELDQYPKFMVAFQKEGMRIEVPWKLYTYGDSSQSNGYVKAGGKQPITIQYTYFLK